MGYARDQLCQGLALGAGRMAVAGRFSSGSACRRVVRRDEIAASLAIYLVALLRSCGSHVSHIAGLGRVALGYIRYIAQQFPPRPSPPGKSTVWSWGDDSNAMHTLWIGALRAGPSLQFPDRLIAQVTSRAPAERTCRASVTGQQLGGETLGGSG